MAEKPIKEAKNITLDGYEVLGKMVKSGGGRRQSATVSEKAKGFKNTESTCSGTASAQSPKTFLEVDSALDGWRKDNDALHVSWTMEELFDCSAAL